MIRLLGYQCQGYRSQVGKGMPLYVEEPSSFEILIDKFGTAKSDHKMCLPVPIRHIISKTFPKRVLLYTYSNCI